MADVFGAVEGPQTIHRAFFDRRIFVKPRVRSVVKRFRFQKALRRRARRQRLVHP